MATKKVSEKEQMMRIAIKQYRHLFVHKKKKMHSLTERVTCTTADINVNMINMKSKWCDLPLNCDICPSQDSSDALIVSK